MTRLGGLRRRWTESGALYLEREPRDSRAEVVIFIHGLGSSAASWIPVLENAPEDVGLLIPDLPGFGSSPSGSLSPLEGATDVVVDLLDRYGTERPVTVAAHSIGAMVAMRALQSAEGAGPRRLVLVAGTLLKATTVAASIRSALVDPPLTAMVSLHAMAGVIPMGPGCARFVTRRPMLRSALLWPFLCAPREVGEGKLMAVLPHRGGFQSARAISSARTVDLVGLMAGSEVPTRLIHGLQDRLISEEEVGTARELLHAECVVQLERCGHWPHIERPRETAAVTFDR